MPTGWRFWIDRGGTFTDLVARAPDGELVVRKVLSVQPQQPGDPAIRALKEVLRLEPDQPLPPGLVEEVRLGTTVATNALLERKLEPVLLLVNAGFADLAAIGDQHRPEIFALRIERPEPLAMRVIEVEARLAADGSELVPLQPGGTLAVALRQALADGYRNVAVALLHSYRHPVHELALGRWLQQLGFDSVLLSHQLSRQPRIVPRLETTVVEAAVRPTLRRYLDQVGAALGASTRLRVMTSSGALQAPAQLHAKDTILSGPAGGMVAAVAAALAAGFGDRPIIGFDMGGTSTDVFHFDGSRGEDAWERASATEIAGLQVQAAMLPIHTVAAGGGSLLRVDGQRLLVGPQSAGSDPGPACYRRGGPLTVTDANLLLGRLPAGALPSVFGPGGDQRADSEVVRQRFLELEAALGPRALGPRAGCDGDLALERLAQGALMIANERMAEAIRRISIQRGHDLRGAVLVCFGGAGGQHGCALAASLGIERVLIHPLAGVLSAWGLGLAHQSQRVERCLRLPLETVRSANLKACIEALSNEARVALQRAGDLGAGTRVRRQVRLELRYPASDGGLVVGLPAALGPGWLTATDQRATAVAEPHMLESLRAAFEALHRRRFGYVVPGEPLMLERVEVELLAEQAEAGPEGLEERSPPQGPSARGAAAGSSGGQPVPELPPDPPSPQQASPLCLPEGEGMAWQRVPLWQRNRLSVGQRLEGPALVLESTGATVLEAGWSARVLQRGELLLERIAPATRPATRPEARIGGWIDSRPELAGAMGNGERLGTQDSLSPVSGPALTGSAEMAIAAAERPAESFEPDGSERPGSERPGSDEPGSDGTGSDGLGSQGMGSPAAGSQAAARQPGEAESKGAEMRGSGGNVSTTRQLATNRSATNRWQASPSGPIASTAGPAAAAPRPAAPAAPSAGLEANAPEAGAWQESRSAALSSRSSQPPVTGPLQQDAATVDPRPAAPDPVTLELYNHRFSAIAEQMGVRLQQSSRSVNIRERLDFSCALFDGRGQLVANAPHIPVHLGSMGESVEALLGAIALGVLPPLTPGDAVAANNPYNGGTHLPDITVISPVFAAGHQQPPEPGAATAAVPLFYVASRGHHADVGGMTPGSMPPFSHDISEEGLLLDNVPLISRGHFDEASWRKRLLSGRHPVRNPDQLLADLQAQVAANRLGVAELQRLMDLQGEADVQAYMAHVQTNAAAAVRDVIDRLHDGEWSVELDDGARIQVAVRIDHRRRRALVDFSGSSPQQAGNGNAPLAITKAAVLYVFRCLVGRAIPLNAGCFAPIDLVVPAASLLWPDPPAAVVAGNVETSQAVVNALFGALGVMAAAQGTMNNLSFGNDRCQYYETICGGTGAGVLADGSGFAGAPAVQSHMTNSRLTDPEILEDRFPVRLERFAIRRGSGGAGCWRGGDGVVRWLRFLEPMTAAILSGSRRVAPFGLAGGSAGQVGHNSLSRADGSVVELPGSAALTMAAGDVLRIETPGGGGYGPAARCTSIAKQPSRTV